MRPPRRPKSSPSRFWCRTDDRGPESGVTIRERLQAVIDAEAHAIGQIRVTDEMVDAVLTLGRAHPNGKVVVTGMGKAGLMAQKFAATLRATGTQAVYLHPGDAAHGDLGVLGQDDDLVAFSTSGKTSEVLEVIASAKRLGVSSVIGITAHPDSGIREHCTVVIDMGTIAEPCHLGLTPSASSAVMLAIGDALALALAELNGFAREGFGLRHRAGYLGSEATR